MIEKMVVEFRSFLLTCNGLGLHPALMFGQIAQLGYIHKVIIASPKELLTVNEDSDADEQQISCKKVNELYFRVPNKW